MFDSLTLVSRSEKPVLSAGEAEDWDAYDVHCHYTFYDELERKYYLYYNNTTKAEGLSGIGRACSEHGFHFTKDPNNPLLCEEENWMLWKCRVMHLAKDDWRMWFGRIRKKSRRRRQHRLVHVASSTSKDGVRWSPPETEPVMKTMFDFTPIFDGKFSALFYIPDVRCIGLAKSKDGKIWDFSQMAIINYIKDSWEGDMICPKWLGKKDDMYILAYEAGKAGKFSIGLAYSWDLINWWRDRRNPIVEPRAGCFDSSFVVDPSLVIKDGKLKVYYGSRDSNGISHVGLAMFTFEE